MGRPIGLQVEVLMLHAVGHDGKEDKIPFLPVHALAVDRRVAFSVNDVDRKPSLVTMAARLGADFVEEEQPTVGGRVLNVGVTKMLQLSLLRLLPGLILSPNEDRKSVGTGH